MRKSWPWLRLMVLTACAGLVALGVGGISPGTSRAAAASATSSASAAPDSAASGPGIPGYWLVASDGGVYNLNTGNYGQLRGIRLARPVVGGTATADGRGYWLVASDGGIFSFGDAGFAGSTGGIPLRQPIVGMAEDPRTGGYWMVAADGGVFSFRAPFYGSTGGIRLRQPIVGMAVTPDAGGYWLVASDGGIFAFGDAHFYGSTGGIRLHQPVVGMAATPTGGGYWLVASDGGIFAFGNAVFRGSTGGIPLRAPVKSMQATADGQGYWLSATDGGVFTFGDAPYLGSSGQPAGYPPIVAMMATANGFPLIPGATGYDISWPQCGGPYPPRSNLAIVGVTDGRLNGPPNPCYQSEVAWAGSDLSSYIVADPLPSPAPPESLNGAYGVCNGNVVCESANFGYAWAVNWISYSRGLGISPTLWWLDVETPEGWNTSPAFYASNNAVIGGAMAGMRAEGVFAGIYATSYQWGLITGNQASYPGVPLWVPGGTTLSNDAASAQAICTGTVGDHVPFAGGRIVMVQYGYVNGGPTTFDPDYACVN